MDLDLIILENPWFPVAHDRGQTTVAGYFQNLSRYHDSLSVFHMTFMGLDNFRDTLDYLLHWNTLNRKIIYIAAHGNGNTLGNAKLNNVCNHLTNVSRNRNIEGVVFGSCLTGGSPLICNMLYNCNLRWSFGYSNSVNWIPSTLIDFAIIESFVDAISSEDFHDNDADIQRHTNNNYCDEQYIINIFSNALSLFSPKYSVGTQGDAMNRSVSQSIRLYFQQYGQGNHPQDITANLRNQLNAPANPPWGW